jgi:hypothetical protein
MLSFRGGQEDAVSASEIIALLKATTIRTRKQKFIVDGFPRSSDEKAAFEREIGQIQLWVQLDNSKVRLCVCVCVCFCAAVCLCESVNVQDGRPAALTSVIDELSSQGKFVAVNASVPYADAFSQLKLPFEPHVVLLVGSSGSGRGEFARRCATVLSV